MASSSATSPDTLVTLKINIEGSNRRFKLPLRDLGASSLPDKLRELLAVPETSETVFERYSDSAAAFIVLDSSNASVYKQLYRAAKAKLKLRLKVTITDKTSVTPKPATVEDEVPALASPTETVIDTRGNTLLPMTSCGYGSSHCLRPFVDYPNGRSELTETNTVDACGLGSSAGPTDFGAVEQQPFKNIAIRKRTCCTPSEAPASVNIPVTRAAAEKAAAAVADQYARQLSAIRKKTPAPKTVSVFSVYCNNCTDAIPDEHYHCSTCDDGDYDLCPTCVEDGVLCGGEQHWMIKRYVKQGKVVTSVTETIAPKVPFSASKATLVEPEQAVVEEVEALIPSEPEATRTCNACIQELAEAHFVTCTTCEDYDLCMACHVELKHGHHPKHAFAPAVANASLSQIAEILLAPGRNTGHHAICDGCDKYIWGVRHKCMDCPDWDFCSECNMNAALVHPGHRFFPVYEPLEDHHGAGVMNQFRKPARHYGIICNGDLCKVNFQSGKKIPYITGDRYKCAVCHDTDFCANCEASPLSSHNKTHPLIKFKTAVRSCSVTTMGDHVNGRPMPVMGDRHRFTTSKATETTRAKSSNAATQVQTVADLEPVHVEESAAASEVTPEPVECTTLLESCPLALPEPYKLEAAVEKAEPVAEKAEPVRKELIAHFVRDVVPDGTVLPAGTVFEQTWYLRNGGEASWPAGCSVKFVGGDNMCAIDPNHPASVMELNSATESTTCYTEVASGQEHGFTVLMRTPSRPGNFISYWRLTGPSGDKFGHRLWCDVTVPELIVKEEPKAIETKAVEPEAKPAVVRSQMIFPKLENESPASSIHAPKIEQDDEYDSDEFLEEIVDEPLGDDETEDGFMTDEEYDILDASDEEYLAEQEKKEKMSKK